MSSLSGENRDMHGTLGKGNIYGVEGAGHARKVMFNQMPKEEVAKDDQVPQEVREVTLRR